MGCIFFVIVHSHMRSRKTNSSKSHTYALIPIMIFRDTDAALREVSEERGAYLSLLEEARFSISQLQDELTDAR